MSAITKVVLAPIFLILWCVPLLAQEKVTFPMAASTKTAGYSPPVGGTEAGLLCPAGPRSPAGRHSLIMNSVAGASDHARLPARSDAPSDYFGCQPSATRD
jgi:hypothetical protein